MNKNKVLQPSFLEPWFRTEVDFSETADKEYDCKTHVKYE